MENLREEILDEMQEIEEILPEEVDQNIPEHQIRFSSASWYKYTHGIEAVIGGAGGISSWLALFLNRANIHTTIYDFDKVERVNLAGQFFSQRIIGQNKATGLGILIKDFTCRDVSVFNTPYDKTSQKHPYMFSGFDNMAARKIMFENWKDIVEEFYSLPEDDEFRVSYRTPIFIDGRLTPDAFQIFCVTPDKIEEYEKTLFDDSEVEEPICSYKQTTHIAAMIGSFMTNFFLNHLNNALSGIDLYDVPFYTSYMSGINILDRKDEFK